MEPSCDAAEELDGSKCTQGVDAIEKIGKLYGA